MNRSETNANEGNEEGAHATAGDESFSGPVFTGAYTSPVLNRDTFRLSLEPSQSPGIPHSKDMLDACSVYVGQVEYQTTEIQLLEYFKVCGRVNRVTIMRTPAGKSKGFAYVEFANAESASQALLLNGSEFNGRSLKITPKRVNIPIFLGRGSAMGRGRGRGGPSGRGRGRGYRGY